MKIGLSVKWSGMRGAYSAEISGCRKTPLLHEEKYTLFQHNFHNVDFRAGRRLITEGLKLHRKRNRMRFVLLMIPGVYQPENGEKTDGHFTPDAEMMAKMGRFNEELKRAGALLSMDGL